VSGYAIDATTRLPGAMVTSAPTGSNPASVAVDAGGKFAYVVNSVSQTVSAYSVASTGQLTPVLAPVATGSQPLYITLSGR
jgi:DNA-binding beta-propeller fold protein YncE